MSAEPEKQTYEEQLSQLESRLKAPEHDEAMLGEVGLAMRILLTRNGESEAHIRQILERQFDQGNLRRESYELVEKLLAKILAEKPLQAAPAAETAVESRYVDTTVLDQPFQPDSPATVTEQLQVGSVLRDRYLLKEQVSEGSMGTVYKALDRRLAETGEPNPFVAIKVLSPKLSRNGAALRALQQEAVKGRCLSHPNIVRFIDLDREDDLFFLVMEWLDGRSLSKILDDNRGNSLDLATAMNVIGQVSRALNYAHQRGVIHADIKPANIIITPEGQVKVIDFGVARIRQKENEGKSHFDREVMRAASPAYSSMQVLTGDEPVAADDVFSLACLMYRLVAGYRVFGPRNAADAAQEGMEPQKPQELNDAQWAVLKKALSYSRVTRYQTPGAFMEAFGTVPDEPVKPRTQSEPEAQELTGPAAIMPAVPEEPELAQPLAVAEAPSVAPQPATANEHQGALLGADETTQVAVDTPMRAEREPIMFDLDEEDDEPPRRSPLRLLVVGIIIVGSVAVVLRTDIVDTLDIDESIETISGYIDEFAGADAGSSVSTDSIDAAGEDALEALDALPETEVADTTAGETGSIVTEELIIDPADGTVTVSEGETAVEDTVVPQPDPLPEPYDFSSLPEPTLLLTLRSGEDAAIPSGRLIIREDSDAAIIDLVREGDLSEAFAVQFIETQFSGNQSTWESGQYQVQNDGLLLFERGQPRARTMVSMRSNPVREPDRQVTLSIRDAATRSIDLGTVRLTLEDDDQRAFEASLPPNTVGFAVNQVSVREFDPAVQVDIVRYRPDTTALEVAYTLTDVTATEGQDYFAPSLPVIYFGPGQRTARILIPLGQDAWPEQDEAFMLELDTPGAPVNSNIFRQIAVMIRDDDS